MIQCGIPVRTMLYSVTDRLDFWLSSSVLVYRSWMLALRGLNVHTTGYWIHEAGYRIHEAGYRIHQVGYRLHQAGYRIHQAGYRIHQSRIQDTSKPDTSNRIHDTSRLVARYIKFKAGCSTSSGIHDTSSWIRYRIQRNCILDTAN